MSKVEEVARAIFEAWREAENAEATWEDALKGHAAGEAEYPNFFRTVELARKEARAAIEAMRTPTEAMRIAGDAKLCTCTGCDCDESLIYGAMISQALNEEG